MRVLNPQVMRSTRENVSTVADKVRTIRRVRSSFILEKGASNAEPSAECKVGCDPPWARLTVQ
jgi:hypothetical protein